VIITKFIQIAVFFLLLDFTFTGRAQSASVLNSGTWYKFSVTADGVYKIDYSQLRNIGANPDQINPKQIKIYTGYNGMLPQANSNPITGRLQEIPLFIAGENDERFNSNDFILFYAQGPDVYSYDMNKSTFRYQNNLFTDKNFYFLTIGADNGMRLAQADNTAGTFPVIQTFDDFAFYETEKYNLLKSGRQWFGEQFDSNQEATIRFTIPGIVENSEMRFISHVMAQSISNSSFQVSINNTPVLTQPIGAIPNTSYGMKGRIRADTVILNSNSVGAPGRTNQDFKYQFTKGGSGLSVGYLDFFIVSFKRRLALYGDQTIFRSFESIQQPVSTFQVSGVGPTSLVWNITDSFQVQNQSFTITGSTLSYASATQPLQTFVVFNPDKSKAPLFESKIENQNLWQLTAPDLLIVTHPSLKPEAQRLANHRQTNQGITAQVVTTEQVYHEFSAGKQDITAIRNFIRHLYHQPSSRLKNVLLFGRGSYDYKNRLLNNTNLVPIYQSRNSLSPLESFSSDDYLGFLETEEGDWLEAPAQYHSLDVGVGRLPVKNPGEARQVVDKLIEYDLNMTTPGQWQNTFLFVADDGDYNIHQLQADQLAGNIELYNPAFHAKKFYLDSFEQLTRASGQYSPEAQKELDLEVQKGALIVNYTGHGSERVWMDERILDETIIQKWRQGPRYPLFVTATCEFGRHDDPALISSGERTLLQYKGGSIGLVTTARLVEANSNFVLNKAFYEAFFTRQGQQFRDMGSVFRDTKNNSSVAGVGNRNFSLLCDPSMKLAIADHQITFDEIISSEGSTDLRALSHVIVNGHVEKQNELYPEFNGELTLTLFDEMQVKETRGDENPPFFYEDRSNLLFHGKAPVKQGAFQIEFILPKNSSAKKVNGKLSAFAASKNREYASGASFHSVGGTNTNPPLDNIPPSIRLFLGDTTFINGGTVSPSTKLIALLGDENGINLSSSPSMNNIEAIIDDGKSRVLNSYYEADAGTYKKGKVIYPLDGLEKGKHKLTLKASDTHNNSATASIDFVVTDGIQIQISEFVNYPNPFNDKTWLEFAHNRPGEDLEAELAIFDLSGRKVIHQIYRIPSSQFRVTLTEWEGRSADGSKLTAGIYVSKLSVRSLLDGSKNDQFTKLIILN
jgi:hypothetical protein